MSSSASPTPMKFEIQKLEGASNYMIWKASMTIYLNYYDCLEVVNRSELCHTEIEDAKSSATMSSIKAWKKKDKTAKMYILTCVSKDWVYLVAESLISASCWSTLQDKFDHYNIISVHHLLRSLLNSKIDNSQSIQDYLTGYDQTWSRLKDRVQNADSDNKLADGLKTFDSDPIKASFLLLSLPDSYAILLILSL
jgi:hypothetical protein